MVDSFDLLVTDQVSTIPAKVKNLVKDAANASFLDGAKSKFIVFKAKDEKAASEESKLKISKFIRTVFFIGEDSSFGVEDVVRVVDEKLGKTYFFVKLEMVK